MLKENLYTKKPLTFNSDGKFRIMLFSDLHGVPNHDPRLKRGITAMVEAEKPDLVFFNGDQMYGLETHEQVQNYLEDVTEVLEKNNIPWAHVYGNHDSEAGLSRDEQQKIYESFPNCLSKRGPDDIGGVGNFSLPIMSSDKCKIAFCIWGLDSREYIGAFDDEFSIKATNGYKTVLPKPFYNGTYYDLIRFEQVMWYYNSSKELEKHNGAKIPALMFFHIALPEHKLIHLNPVETAMTGDFNEQVCCAETNSGMFTAVLQRGDVKGIYVGHDHNNNYEGTYAGVRLGFDGAMGFNSYGMDGETETERSSCRGCRIFEINESDCANYKTRFIKVNDYINVEDLS
ncbi:MAG: metallophosphoesterase family protein [Eubacteriales bacterium]|nr:metallophosphoesterase family protein [Eubacteriales bacterium]MDD4475839.1 metallophosphoesterase family protein [Eubacteriales bacterium]